MRTYSGGPPKPCSVMTPDIAWINGSNPGRSRYGPADPEGGDEQEAEARFDRGRGGVTAARAPPHAGPHFPHDDVGALGEPMHDGAAIGLLQIHGDRPLSAIPAVEAVELT